MGATGDRTQDRVLALRDLNRATLARQSLLDRPRALEEEAARLAAFLEPLEPAAYARYRRSRARR